MNPLPGPPVQAKESGLARAQNPDHPGHPGEQQSPAEQRDGGADYGAEHGGRDGALIAIGTGTVAFQIEDGQESRAGGWGSRAGSAWPRSVRRSWQASVIPALRPDDRLKDTLQMPCTLQGDAR